MPVCLFTCLSLSPVSLSVLAVDSMYGGPPDSLGSEAMAAAAAAASPQSYVDAIRTGLDASAREQGQIQKYCPLIGCGDVISSA